MDIELSRKEIEILNKADNDLFTSGKTTEKCPRCGNDIVVEEYGNSYIVKCKTENCIGMNYRGI